MSRVLDELGRKVAHEQDERHPNRAELARARAALLASLAGPTPRRGRARLGLAVAGFLALGVGIGIGHFFGSYRETPALSLRVGSEVVETSGSALAAPAERPLTLNFSDGSEVRLDARSEVQVERLDSVGAQLRLSRGRAELSIVHRDDTHWKLEAGPFTTHVVGTRFSVAWLPEQEQFELTMLDGAVELTGPLVGNRRLARGERIQVSLKRQSVTWGPLDAPEPSTTGSAAANTEQVAQPEFSAGSTGPLSVRAPEGSHRRRAHGENTMLKGDAPPVPAALPASADPRSVSTAEELLDAELARLSAEGRYGDVVAAALRAGWRNTIERAPAQLLARLGDAARLSNDATHAREAYEQLRARFPGSRDAAQAAYALGRLAHDGSSGFAEAARWFTLYLAEAPRGPLAREAMGRLLEAQLQSNAEGEARVTAQHYLKSFPEGPHAALARRVSDAANGARPSTSRPEAR
jgi:hypothetical protein